tara:strand:+ start:17 stop:274 length:258 start_codon:yes stop_codon:yes gene_type:complete
VVKRKEIRVMNIKDLNPVVNVGTEKSPLMVLCATTMMMMFEESTGRKYDPDNVEEYIQYCDGYRDGYNATLEGNQLTKVYGTYAE